MSEILQKNCNTLPALFDRVMELAANGKRQNESPGRSKSILLLSPELPRCRLSVAYCQLVRCPQDVGPGASIYWLALGISQRSVPILRPTNKGNGTRPVWWRITRAAAAAAAAARVVRKRGEGVLPSLGVDDADLHATGSVLLDLGREVGEKSLSQTGGVSWPPNLSISL